jgi:hypothetical protein
MSELQGKACATVTVNAIAPPKKTAAAKAALFNAPTVPWKYV